jgi:hypothetical protein
LGPNVDEIAELQGKIGLITVPGDTSRIYCFPEKNPPVSPFFERGGIYIRGKGFHPFLTYHRRFLIGPLLDAFGVGSDATTAKLSVTNVGCRQKALPDYLPLCWS